MSDYKISDEDVESVVRYMNIFHPDKAETVYCRSLLEYFKSGLYQIARTDPDNIEELYESLYNSYEAYLKET
jgi:hypothetical protein